MLKSIIILGYMKYTVIIVLAKLLFEEKIMELGKLGEKF